MSTAPHRPAVVSRRAALTLLGASAGLLLAPGTAIAAATRRVRAICRDAWGARPRSGPYRRHRISRITVHHSAVGLWDNRKAPARFRSHQANHQARGWPDIAYHLLIDRRGHVYRGRPIWARGNTGTNYNPSGHLLVLCEGNFDTQWPSEAQVRSLVKVLAWASVKYDVPLYRIRGHRHYASTSCPGDRLATMIDNGTLRRRVRRRVDGGVSLRTICGDTADRLVARIVSGDA